MASAAIMGDIGEVPPVRDRISASRQSVAQTLSHLAKVGGILSAKAAAADADLLSAESTLADLFSDLHA